MNVPQTQTGPMPGASTSRPNALIAVARSVRRLVFDIWFLPDSTPISTARY